LPALLYQRDSNPARYAAGRILPLRVVGGSSIMQMIAILALLCGYSTLRAFIRLGQLRLCSQKLRPGLTSCHLPRDD
jgi:hypothetical protein